MLGVRRTLSARHNVLTDAFMFAASALSGSARQPVAAGFTDGPFFWQRVGSELCAFCLIERVLFMLWLACHSR